jgi:AcrR family transcriptional regulator
MSNRYSVRVAARPRTRLDVEARRTQLLDVGMRLFATRPYDDVWVEEIAEQAGVSRGLLYHYFPTKRDFFVAVVGHAVRDVYELTAPDETLPPLERLRAAVDAYLDYAEGHVHGILTTHRAGIGADPDVRALVEGAQSRQVERMVRQIAGGENDSPVLALALRGWLGLLVAGAVDWLERGAVERDVLRDLLVNGFVGLVLGARQADPELDRSLPPPPVD